MALVDESGPAGCGAADPAAAEAEILAALDRGDVRAAFAIVVRELGVPVYRYCRQLVGDDAAADDVHQTVFVQVFEHLAGFARRSSVRSWVFAIAHNRGLDAIKRGQRFTRRFSLRDEPPELADAAPSAADRLAARTQVEAVTRCLERLPPHIRTAVLLRYQEGFSYDEMARVCLERPGTLQARVVRAMPLLRRCIEEHGGAA